MFRLQLFIGPRKYIAKAKAPVKLVQRRSPKASIRGSRKLPLSGQIVNRSYARAPCHLIVRVERGKIRAQHCKRRGLIEALCICPPVKTQASRYAQSPQKGLRELRKRSEQVIPATC